MLLWTPAFHGSSHCLLPASMETWLRLDARLCHLISARSPAILFSIHVCSCQLGMNYMAVLHFLIRIFRFLYDPCEWFNLYTAPKKRHFEDAKCIGLFQLCVHGYDYTISHWFIRIAVLSQLVECSRFLNNFCIGKNMYVIYLQPFFTFMFFVSARGNIYY